MNSLYAFHLVYEPSESEMAEYEEAVRRNREEKERKMAQVSDWKHDYEPGEDHHPMHTDPLCTVCGEPKKAMRHR